MREAAKAKVAAQFNMPVATQILPAATFYPAEGYHQNFHVTNAARYKFYKFGCGRAQRLQEIWGKPGCLRSGRVRSAAVGRLQRFGCKRRPATRRIALSPGFRRSIIALASRPPSCRGCRVTAGRRT